MIYEKAQVQVICFDDSGEFIASSVQEPKCDYFSRFTAVNGIPYECGFVDAYGTHYSLVDKVYIVNCGKVSPAVPAGEVLRCNAYSDPTSCPIVY